VPYDLKVTEALDVLIAGADTTASTLMAGILHILSEPDIHAKLRQALNDTDPARVQLLELEKIGYLVSKSEPCSRRSV
jgi:cytochrome P450